MVFDKKAWDREYYKRHNRKDYFREYFHKEENKKKKDDYMKEYGQRPLVKERIKKYELDNRERFREGKNKYIKEWMGREYKKNGKFAVGMRLRCLFKRALEYYSQTGKMWKSEKYGIDYKVIIEHLNPFPENIKEYHIDHIIPLSLFDLNNKEQIKRAFSPENHQWLTIKENLEKGNKLIMPH